MGFHACSIWYAMGIPMFCYPSFDFGVGVVWENSKVRRGALILLACSGAFGERNDKCFQWGTLDMKLKRLFPMCPLEWSRARVCKFIFVRFCGWLNFGFGSLLSFLSCLLSFYLLGALCILLVHVVEPPFSWLSLINFFFAYKKKKNSMLHSIYPLHFCYPFWTSTNFEVFKIKPNRRKSIFYIPFIGTAMITNLFARLK